MIWGGDSSGGQVNGGTPGASFTVLGVSTVGE